MTITDYAHRWAFEEGSGTGTADDWSAANGAAGALTATLGSGASWVAGKIGSYALAFDKTTNGYANFGNSTDFSNGYSFGFWFFLDDAASNADGVVWGGPSGNYVLYFDSTNLYHSAGVGNFVTVAHSGLASLRSWNHYGIRRNPATGDCDFFWNGTRLGATQTMGAGFVNNRLLLSQFGSYDTTVGSSGTAQFAARVRIDDARSYGRALSDSEFAALAAFTSGGTAYTQSGSDSIAITSGVARAVVLPRATSDAAAVSSSLARATSSSRATSDAISVTDASTRSAARPRSTADSFVLANAVTRATGSTRLSADVVSVASAVSRLAALARAVADSVLVADAASRVAISLMRAASDAMAISDATSISSSRSRSTSDSLTLSNAVTRSASRLRSSADAISLIASSGGTLSMMRATFDAIVIGDTESRPAIIMKMAVNSFRGRALNTSSNRVSDPSGSGSRTRALSNNGTQA